MITTKKINSVVIKKVPVDKEDDDKRPILGAEMFPEIYANVFLCAKKKSGKSTVIYNILKACTGKHTKVIAFVGTLHKDRTYRKLQKKCEKSGIYFEGHTSLKENGVDLLEQLIDQLSEEYPQEGKGKDKPKNPIILCDDSDEDEDEEESKRKCKYRAPDYIFILDDLSRELKTPMLEAFLKMNRHFKSKVLISNQYLNNMAPESRKQIDYWLVFKGQPQKKLDEIYMDADLAVDHEQFYDVYKEATEKKYSFLYIDTVDNTFRRNFDEEFTI